MNTTTQIIIQKAANGYIVTAPFQPRILTNDDMIRHQTRVMKEELHGDPLLKNLQQPEVETDNDEFKIESVPNVFIFKGIDELIGFLKTYL